MYIIYRKALVERSKEPFPEVPMVNWTVSPLLGQKPFRSFLCTKRSCCDESSRAGVLD